MISLIEKKRPAVKELCRKYRVTCPEVFGSAAGGFFDPEESDIHFLVQFQIGSDPGPWMANYFDFRNELKNWLTCKVDFVIQSGIKNPCFIKSKPLRSFVMKQESS